MMTVFEKFAAGLWKILSYILAALLASLLVIVFWQVICRFVLRNSTGWTSEVSTLLFVWATYLGAALAIRSGAQICMNLVVVKTKRPVRQIIMLVAALVCEIFYGIFTAAGIAAMQKFANTTTSALRIPMPWAYGAFAFSGCIMLLYGLGEIAKPIRELMGSKEDSEKED